MNILVLNYEFPPLGGGASPVSYEIAKGMVKLGHKVDVVTMGFKGLPKKEEVDGVMVHRVKCIRRKKEICHPWEQLTYLITAYFYIKKLLKTKRYDISHTHFLIPTGILSLIFNKKNKLPYIITAHGSDVPGHNPDRFKFLHKFSKPILNIICHNAKTIISPSHFLKNSIERTIGGFNVKIIPNGIDVNKFKPGIKKKIIISAGKLIRGKGFHQLINAVSDIDLGYEVHICGDGPMMPILKQMSVKSKTKIVLHGWINNNSERYKTLLETASIYVLVSEKENASISLLEAMSAGCAIITSNISGCPETVGDSGILVDPNNPNKILQVLKELISDENKLNDLQAKARKKVLEQFDWNEIIQKYLLFLNSEC